MTQIIPGMNLPYSRDDLKHPERLNSPERMEEQKKYWDTQKVDDNHYMITKSQYWIGVTALVALFLIGIKNSIKNISRLIG